LQGVLKDCKHGVACDRVKGNAHLYMSYDSALGVVQTRAHIEKALTHYRISPGQYSTDTLMALIAAADLERRQGDAQAAKQRVAEAESVASQISVKAYEYARLQHVKSAIAFEEGNFSVARETLDKLIAAGVESRVGRKMRWSIFTMHTHVLAGQGLPQLAIQSATESLTTIDQRMEPVAFAHMLLERARAYAILGETAHANDQVSKALATIRENGVLEQSEVWSRTQRVEGEILARNGDLFAAKERLLAAISLMRNHPPANTLPMIHALDVLGTVQTASGDFNAAVRSHQEELELLQRRSSANRALYLRASLQLARAQTQSAPSGVHANETRTLAADIIGSLPEQSYYRKILSDVAAGALGANQALLLF
jgi:tetratricopeptide (TPR) repeat protein